MTTVTNFSHQQLITKYPAPRRPHYDTDRQSPIFVNGLGHKVEGGWVTAMRDISKFSQWRGGKHEFVPDGLPAAKIATVNGIDVLSTVDRLGGSAGYRVPMFSYRDGWVPPWLTAHADPETFEPPDGFTVAVVARTLVAQNGTVWGLKQPGADSDDGRNSLINLQRNNTNRMRFVLRHSDFSDSARAEELVLTDETIFGVYVCSIDYTARQKRHRGFVNSETSANIAFRAEWPSGRPTFGRDYVSRFFDHRFLSETTSLWKGQLAAYRFVPYSMALSAMPDFVADFVSLAEALNA